MKIYTTVSHFIASVILVSLITCGCIHKEDFNFNNLSSVNIDGEWGIPVINSSYSMLDLIHDSEPKNAWVVDPNGFVKFTYNFEDEKIINGSDILVIDDISTSIDFYFPVIQPLPPSMTFEFDKNVNLDNSLLQIDSAIIKSGSLQLSLNTNIDQPYTITLTSPNLVSSSGTAFSATLSNNTPQRIINLQNYKLRIPNSSSDNKISFHGVITVSPNHTSPLQAYIGTMQIGTQDLKFKYMIGKSAPHYFHLSSDQSFNIFNDNFTGSFTVFRPQIKISIENSFGMASGCLVDTFALHNESNTTFYPLVPEGTFFSCNASTAVGTFATKDQDIVIPNIAVSAQYGKIKFVRDIVVNPNGFSAGSIWVDESSTINIKTTFEVPLESTVDSLYYRDTLDFKLEDFAYSDNIEKVTFRLVLTNGLPFNLDGQVLFLDTVHNVILDSLLTSPQLVRSATVGPAPDYYVISPTTTPPQFIDVEGTRLDNILKANKVILRFKMNTTNSGSPIKIYSTQNIRAILGARVKYGGNILN